MFRIPTPVVLLFGLLLATCVIAYWSDNLGKKLGKKRISLFGLRPRQTATLISMASSVGIMLFTLAVLLIFSDQVRDMVLRVDRLRDSNQHLRSVNEALNAESGKLKASVEQSQAKAREAERRAREASRAATQATNAANRRVRAVQAQIADAEKRLGTARVQLAQAVRARAAAQLGQSRALAGEKRARQEARRVADRLAEARTVLDNIKKQYDLIQARLRKNQADLSRSETKLQNSLKANRRLSAVSEEQIKDLESRRREVEGLKAELGRLDASITEARKVFDELDKQIRQVSMGTIVVDIGQAFAEVVVPPKVEADKLRATLRRLLDAGSQAAVRLGGHSYENPDTGIIRALHLATFTLPEGQGSINETALLEHFVNYLATLNVPVSVRLVAVQRYARNRVQNPGEPPEPLEFQARLEAVPVNRIYSQGETVAVAIIDGSQRDVVIFGQLIKLVNAGGAAAREKGVTPLLSDTVPEFFAWDTNEQIFDTLRSLQAQGKPMQVRMVTAEDIYSVDPMTIRFIVESDSE